MLHGGGKAVQQAAALFTALLIGTAPWFLGFGRLAFELHMSSLFIFGGALLGLAIARNKAVGGLITGGLLGLGVEVHFWWMHVVVGSGLAALIMLRLKLLRTKSFWLALVAFVLVSHGILLNYFSGSINSPTGSVDFMRAWITGLSSLEMVVPWMLSGQAALELLNAELIVPILPLMPLLLWHF
jgi:hypothetical protein